MEFFYEPGSNAAIRLYLRRTLVRSVIIATVGKRFSHCKFLEKFTMRKM